MLGVCHRYARTPSDAEDILQEAFIKVFDKIGQFKFEGSFEGWIRKILEMYTGTQHLANISEKLKLSYDAFYSERIIISKWQSFLAKL